MLSSLILILPVFLVIAFGILLDIFRVIPKETGSIIGSYVLYVALPVLLIHILSSATSDEILHGGFWLGILSAQVIVYIFGYLGEFLFGTKKHGPAAVIGLTTSCSNMAFLGLPVVASLMPGNHEALVAAGLAAITPNVVSIPCLVQLEYLKTADGDPKKTISRLLKSILFNPFIISTFVGLFLGLSEIGLWEPVDKAASMVGNTTAPCMLLALGLDLRDKVRLAFTGDTFNFIRFGTSLLMKLVIHPILAWGLLSLMGVHGTWLAVGVIMSGTATALMTTVIADIYRCLAADVATITVASNILNLATLTLLTAILHAQGLL